MQDKWINDGIRSAIGVVAQLVENEKELQNSSDPVQKLLYASLCTGLEVELVEWYEEFKEEYLAEGRTEEALQADMRPVNSMWKVYQLLKKAGNREEILRSLQRSKGAADFDGLPDDIREEIAAGFQNSQDTGLANFEDNPFFKELVRRETKGQQEAETTISIARSNDMTIRSGELSIYESEILNNLAKCKREGFQTLKSGECFLSLGQLYKWISGGAKDSLSDVQRAELMEALRAMRRRSISYTTEEHLADVLGVEIPGELSGFKVKEADEQLLTCDFYTGEIKGQTATVIVFKFARVINRMLDVFPWYETTSEAVKRIQYTRNGLLKDWNLTKERIELRTSILRFAFSYIRARTAGKPYSNRKPYADIFEECKIDTTHRQKKKRKIEDIAVILNHLQRIGLISSWEEYTNRGSKKPDGIAIRVAKALTEGG